MFAPCRPYWPSLMFVGKARAHPRMEYLKGASLGFAPASSANIRLGWNGLPGLLLSSLLCTFVNYGRKKVYKIWPRSRTSSRYKFR